MAGPRDPEQGRVTRAFFARPVLQVARELLGCTVSHAGVTVRLTEVEAYGGANDPGSHAFRGRTPRNAVMFGGPGGLYVYLAYGMHWCANLVCGPSGVASAVLLRAGEVVGGLDLARCRRAGAQDRDLARGPARLALTLALSRDQNGLDTLATDSPLVMRATASSHRSGEPGHEPFAADGPGWTDSGPEPPASTSPVVATGPRVGVSGPGGDGAAYPWRFWLEGEETVSVFRPGKVRPPKPANAPSDP